MGNTLSEALCCIDMMKKFRTKTISNSAKKKRTNIYKNLVRSWTIFPRRNVCLTTICLSFKKEGRRKGFLFIDCHSFGWIAERKTIKEILALIQWSFTLVIYLDKKSIRWIVERRVRIMPGPMNYTTISDWTTEIIYCCLLLTLKVKHRCFRVRRDEFADPSKSICSVIIYYIL